MRQNPDVVIIGGRFGWALCNALLERHPDWEFLFVMRDKKKVAEASETGLVDQFFGVKISQDPRVGLESRLRLKGRIFFHTLDDFIQNFKGSVNKIFIPAVPSSRIRGVLSSMLKKGVPKTAFSKCEILAVSKGMETNSLLFPHEIIDSILNRQSVVALGGNLAFDFAAGDPMLMEIAGYRVNTRRVANFFNGAGLILYQTFNRRKLSLAGPMKNIHSLATGMASEIYGNSSVSTVATLGLSEYEKAAFIIQFREKFQPLARVIQKIPFHFRSVPIDGGAMSDYHLFRFTRNFGAGQAFVKEIRKGRTASHAIENISQKETIESFSSAEPTKRFLNKLGCFAPVIDITADILAGRYDPESGVKKIIQQENLSL